MIRPLVFTAFAAAFASCATAPSADLATPGDSVAAIAPSAAPFKVVIIGDSTVSSYAPERYPQMGWGQVLHCAIGEGISVINDAIGGRSTKTFREEGRWDRSLARIEPGDVMLIQFGHNDAYKRVHRRYIEARPGFHRNLTMFVEGVRGKGGTPVLITPVAQRSFENGRTRDTHGEYDDVVREVAVETGAALIDLQADSRALVGELGEERSWKLFLNYEPGEHAPFPNGIKDTTHFSERGARAMAQQVATRLETLPTPLRDRINGSVKALQPDFEAGGPACQVGVPAQE